MKTIDIASEDAVWIGRNLYCKTPQALEVALARLREIGYTVKDQRTEGYSARRGETTPEKMEADGWSLWYASLDDIRRGKCKSCKALISTRGIRMHGHKCESCGKVTYLKMTEGSTIRFSFIAEEYAMFGPELNMEVIHWDDEAAWLYLKPEALERGGMCVVHGEKAQTYLDDHSDKWERVEFNGAEALKLHYANNMYTHEDDIIDVRDIWGHVWNHKIVQVWDGIEYDEYDRNFPLPDSVSIYESWHWAPLEPTANLHERIISAAGQVSRADYYYQDGRAAWSRENYEVMGKFIRHFTTLDADRWDRVEAYLPLDGPGGIGAVAKFCHPDAEVRYEPNIGNFLTVAADAFAGRRSFTSRELMAAEHALIGDPATQEFVDGLLRRNDTK